MTAFLHSFSLFSLFSLFYFFLRDAHFVIGEEDGKKSEEDDNLVSDPKYAIHDTLFLLCNFVLVFFFYDILCTA